MKNRAGALSAAAVGKCSSNVHVIHKHGMAVLYCSKRRNSVYIETGVFMKAQRNPFFVQYC